MKRRECHDLYGYRLTKVSAGMYACMYVCVRACIYVGNYGGR